MRWRGSGKDTTDGYKKIDVRFLQRRGYLVPGTIFPLWWTRNGECTGSIQCETTHESVILTYKHRSFGGEDWTHEKYPVRLSHTPCNYGGTRPWLHCPARGCGRRAAILYGGAIFACRHCHQLAYECQHERDYARALRRSQTIHERLGGSGCVADGIPPKPKGMHWSTYKRLEKQFWDFESTADLAVIRHFGFVV